MKVLIIEDEQPAAKRLRKLIQEFRPSADILDVIDSVETAVDWFSTFPAPDLVFMDIQLADGISFNIFQKTDVVAPVIFTTAYDQYTLKAFKVNSIDYLLKPIDPAELEQALNKFDRYNRNGGDHDRQLLNQLVRQFSKNEYKERFLVKVGTQLVYIPVKEIAWCFSEDRSVFIITHTGKRYLLDFTLDQLTDKLNPAEFFRVNRKFIIRLSAIQKIHTWFNSRLKLELKPVSELEIIVSRDRVPEFKSWLDK